MLILTRGIGEVIRIGDETKIVIFNVSNKVVRIGIEAPRSQKVYREELYYRIQEENAGLKAAAAADDTSEVERGIQSVEKISNTTVRYKIKRDTE